MVKRTSSRTKDQLLEENGKLRQLIFELYSNQKKSIYVMRNGNLPDKFIPGIEEGYEQWCKHKGI